MRDGKTHKLETADRRPGIDGFLRRCEAKLTTVSGQSCGDEFVLDRERMILGRGPGVDITIRDSAASRQHAAIEFRDDGFHVRDLGSTNGLFVNGTRVDECGLGDGDCLEIGTHRLQLILSEREEAPNTYVLTADD